ncbi:hypothetical protein AGMMS49546_01580 [Spirochaetia bacterium]|nr:hypothetical protein AGMMS49546_01580 [Spirochaetia bacterium]
MDSPARIITLVSPNGEQKISVSGEKDVLRELQNAGICLPAFCGGQGSCGKCRVRVIAGAMEASAADRAHFSAADLDAGCRLACTAFPLSDITVEIPSAGEEDFSALSDFEQIEPFLPGTSNEAPLETRPHTGKETSPRFAIAVDIGTTTLALALADLRTGKICSRLSTVNRQREFGADVISRIRRANAGDLGALSQCVRRQIAGCIRELYRKARQTPAQEGSRGIRKIAVAGNTTMLHLLLNLSCETLGRSPFTPVTLDMVSIPYHELFGEGIAGGTQGCETQDSDTLNCEVVILPGISTYVGADITAGILFAGLHKSANPLGLLPMEIHKEYAQQGFASAPAVLMDIGTNGEMVLAHGGKLLCTATAAGPAFEGGNILWGTGSVPGAISRVGFRDGKFEIAAIGNQPPIGICGSAVVDTVYQGLKQGYILSSGRFSEKLAGRDIVLAKSPEGRDIVFCQKDVRELQLGKSAIRSGLDALLNHAGLSYDDIQKLYIAGGFGFNLNLESCAGIGLIPAALKPKVSLIGNSALGGAIRYLLNAGTEKDLLQIKEQAEEYSLPTDSYFNENFITNIDFEI